MTAFLECPICFGLLRNAVETDCGHCFCADCLNKTRKHENSCPTCRKQIQFVHPSFIVRDLVAKYGGLDGREKLEADAAAQKERDDDVNEHEDPLIIAMQFKRWTDCCCGGGSGAFDPEDVFARESLEEFLAADFFHDTLDKVNKAIKRWTPGFFSTCFAYCLWPCCCCCMLYVFSEYAVWAVEEVLRTANEASERAQMGFAWTLMHMDGEDREAGLIDHRFFLVLTVDPVRARRHVQSRAKPAVQSPGQSPGNEEIEAARRLAAEKEAEIQRLRRENELIHSKLLERGLKVVRTVSGRVVSPVFRPATRPQTPHVRSPFSTQSSSFSSGRESIPASPRGASPRAPLGLPNVDEGAVLEDDVAAAQPASGAAEPMSAQTAHSLCIDLPQISLPRVRVLRASSRRATTATGELSPRLGLSPTAAQAADAARRRSQVMQEPSVQQMLPERTDTTSFEHTSAAERKAEDVAQERAGLQKGDVVAADAFPSDSGKQSGHPRLRTQGADVGSEAPRTTPVEQADVNGDVEEREEGEGDEHTNP